MRLHLRSEDMLVGTVLLGGLLAGCGLLGGCGLPPRLPPDPLLRQQATACLTEAIRYPDDAGLRIQGLEAAAEVFGAEARLPIREALQDKHAGVRFAACAALGKLQDRSALALVRPLADDPDPNVSVAASFALEKMGESSKRRGKAWMEILRRHEQPLVRRNAAMLLGMLGNKNVTHLLRSVAAEDKDEGVQLQVQEALAVLGDGEAVERFIRDAYGGVGHRQLFALLVLGKVQSDNVLPDLRARLANAPLLEDRLAAARSLGMHGDASGYEVALRALTQYKPNRDLADDPPENQMMRIGTMAAMALGDMKDRRALGWLRVRMDSSPDPRVRVAAARSILMILNANDAAALR